MFGKYGLSLHCGTKVCIITERSKNKTIIVPCVFQVSLQPRLTDEELYELSLAREPRMHSHSVRKLMMQCSFHYTIEFL